MPPPPRRSSASDAPITPRDKPRTGKAVQPLLSLTLPAEMGRLADLRHATREALSSCQRVPPRAADEIETIVGELATNAVVHAPTELGYSVLIELDGDAEALVVTVSDHGAGFRRDAVPAPGTPRPDADGSKERLGGWGLPMVEMMADSVEIASNVPQGSTVKAVKFLRA
jgi:anti-sigma regulatory factor (Ser/Thr protein kinase)